MNSLRSLALEISVPERTLRRAAAEGLIRGYRPSPRRFHLSFREEMYLRRHWRLLAALRERLRTEPNVRLAVLFGSVATGQATERSDLDIAVALHDDAVGRLADLSGRLSRRLERDVQVVRMDDAERSPVLMAAILAEGRVLVDRDGLWPRMKALEEHWRRRARRAEGPIEDAMEDLDAEPSSAP